MSWEEFSIDELCLLVTDGAHSSPKEVESGYPMPSSKDMADNDFDFSNVKQISEGDYLKLKKANCQPELGDVLIIKDGNSYLKKIFAVKIKRELVVLSSIAILRPDQEQIVPLFFQFTLRNPETKKMMENYVSGAAIPRIVMKDFKTMKIPLPPLSTQKKIAGILSAYDDLIENNLKRIKLLEEAAQNIYREWFVHFRYPGHEDVPINEETGLPEGWERKAAIEVFSINIGKTPPRKETHWFSKDDGRIWASISDMNKSSTYLYETKERIKLEGVDKFNIKTVARNSVLLSFKLTIGSVVITTRDTLTNEAIAHFNIDSDSPGTYYTYQFLNNFPYSILGSTSSIGKALNSKIVKKIPFVVPSDEILDKYNNCVEKTFEQIDNLSQQNMMLKEARDILLPRLMNQTIEV